MSYPIKVVGVALLFTCADAYGNALARVHPDFVKTSGPCGDSITTTMPLQISFTNNFGHVSAKQVGIGSVRMDFRKQQACYSFEGIDGFEITPKGEICLRIDIRNAAASEIPNLNGPNAIHVTARLPSGEEMPLATLTRFGAERAYLFNLRRCQRAGNEYN